MAFTDLFIRKPVLSIVVSALILIAGIQAITNVSVRQYPRSDNAAITITTAYVGASAELVRGFVTTPLERAVAAADGIDYIKSESTQGVSTINVRLKLNYDPIKALSEVSAKVDQVRNDLPPESEVPILNIVSADSEFASAYLSFTSDVLEQNQVTDYLTRVVQPKLSALKGVQRADILGARTFAMRIWLKPEKMAGFNVSPTEVRQALQANNVLAAVGGTKGALVQVNLTADTNLQSVEEFRRLVVAERNEQLIRLSDIADVVLGAEDYQAEVRFSGEKAVFIGIWVLPTANSLDVVKRVRDAMDEIQTAMPEGMTGSVSYDATEYIDHAIQEVIKTMVETLVIVVLVIFLFLGSIRSAFIPVLAIPLSLVGAVFLMQVAGFSLNLLTLLAIVLSVGLVVDDAIVVVENVQRHLTEGRPPMEAAQLGARELLGPVIAMTITLTAVYTPIGLQGGLTGALFREFAFTLAGAVLISGIVALTLSPMLASRMLKPGEEQRGFSAVVSRTFAKIRDRYQRVLRMSLRQRPAMYCLWLGLTLLIIPMFSMSPKELAPEEDQGVIFGILNASANATLDQTQVYAEAANDAFFSAPETEFTFQITNPSFGFGGMVTVPWRDRDRTVSEILPEMQQQMAAITGIELFLITPPALPGGGQFPVEFVIASTAEMEQLVSFAQELQQIAMNSGLFAFPPMIDVKLDQPNTEWKIDRALVADLGLNLQQVSADLGVLLGGSYVNRFDKGGRSYKVIPQVKRVNRLTEEELRGLYISGSDSRLISLGSIAEIENQVVARSLNRMQQFNAVMLSGVPIRPLNEVLTFMEQEAKQLLPKDYVIDYTGESRQLRRESNKFLPAMGFALLLIFMVLAIQFNGFRDPLIILAGSVPLAMFGALIFTFLKMLNPNLPFWTDSFSTTLNIYSQVGIVTLIGLVAKNGILMVEFANQLQLKGVAKLQAIEQAALTRLRPILMTTVATVAGHFPLVLVTGAGAEARNSIGLVLVGGMAIGTVLTLLILPALYMLIARDFSIDSSKAAKLADAVIKAPNYAG